MAKSNTPMDDSKIVAKGMFILAVGLVIVLLTAGVFAYILYKSMSS